MRRGEKGLAAARPCKGVYVATSTRPALPLRQVHGVGHRHKNQATVFVRRPVEHVVQYLEREGRERAGRA